MINFVAKFVHAFALHFFYSGVGLVGRVASGATVADFLAIATAFALAIVAMSYCIGPAFGSRVAPADTLVAFATSRGWKQLKHSWLPGEISLKRAPS